MTSVTASHCSREPGKWNAAARLAADRGVDRQRHPHVHGIADRPTDQCMWSVHRPGESIAFGGREQDVFLDVVEVLVRQARLLLGERCIRLRLGVGLEGAEIVLEPGDERDVADRLLGRDRIEEVPEHASVDVAVLLLGGATRPGGEEDVRRGRSTHRCGDGVGVLEIRDERRDSLVEPVRAAAEASDLPTVDRRRRARFPPLMPVTPAMSARPLTSFHPRGRPGRGRDRARLVRPRSLARARGRR